MISSPAPSRSYTGGSLLQEAAWVQWGHPKKPWGVWGGVMRTPPPQCWCPPWGEGSPAALIAAARPHAGRHRCFFGTAVLLARGRGQQSPADAMQQQRVCMGGGGGTKHPNASLTPPPAPLTPALSLFPGQHPNFLGVTSCPFSALGGCGCGCPGPGRVKAAQRAGGRAARVFLLRHQLLARLGRLSAACSFSLPSSQGWRGHVRWKAPESRGGDGKKGRGASEASPLASAVNSCRGGEGGAGLFSETGVLGGGCVPWGLFSGVTLR